MLLNTTEKTWLDTEIAALIDFARGAKVSAGFGTLDATGKVEVNSGAQLWINCRMTHVFCLALLRGDESAREFATHGIKTLNENFYDAQNGGFFSVIDLNTTRPRNEQEARKAAYAHGFVLLAATSGIQAKISGATELYEKAVHAHNKYFWEEEFGLVCESWDKEFTKNEAYRGANANMHTLEAALASWDVTQDPIWLQKAASILQFILPQAEKINWRIPEHFDENWQLLPEFNRENKADPFRPYGVTPGHGIEWARLTLQFWLAVKNSDLSTKLGISEPWVTTLPKIAIALFDQAVADGWDSDGAPGIVYTTAFDGKPIVHERMHWTICEALAAASTLHDYGKYVNDTILAKRMRSLFETFLAYAQKHVINEKGSWTHELDRHNNPSTLTWSGKPDVYHAVQALLIPLLPLKISFAGGI